MAEDYIWTQREGEPPLAYQAFRSYLKLRNVPQVAVDQERAKTTCDGWSKKWQWAERGRAYDAHLLSAETDGMVDAITRVRQKHLDLADKLLDHLDTRLDDAILRKQDPTVRWTQAFAAAVKAQQGAFLIRDDARTSEDLKTAEELIRRIESIGTSGP